MNPTPPSSTAVIATYAAVLFAIDMLWIKGFSTLHRKVIQDVSKEPPQFRYGAGALFYIVAATCWYHFVYLKSTPSDDNWKDGGLLGLAMYSTYDLTMVAAYKQYPVWYAMTDIAWGTGAMALATHLTMKVFQKK